MTLRVPVPIFDIDSSVNLRERFDYYKSRPAEAANLIETTRGASVAKRKAREDRLRASWIYGEDRPDV